MFYLHQSKVIQSAHPSPSNWLVLNTRHNEGVKAIPLHSRETKEDQYSQKRKEPRTTSQFPSLSLLMDHFMSFKMNRGDTPSF